MESDKEDVTLKSVCVSSLVIIAATEKLNVCFTGSTSPGNFNHMLESSIPVLRSSICNNIQKRHDESVYKLKENKRKGRQDDFTGLLNEDKKENISSV